MTAETRKEWAWIVLVNVAVFSFIYLDNTTRLANVQAAQEVAERRHQELVQAIRSAETIWSTRAMQTEKEPK